MLTVLALVRHTQNNSAPSSLRMRTDQTKAGLVVANHLIYGAVDAYNRNHNVPPVIRCGLVAGPKGYDHPKFQLSLQALISPCPSRAIGVPRPLKKRACLITSDESACMEADSQTMKIDV